MASKNRPQTSLQKQLARIRGPATERVRSSNFSKYKDSFLFEPREAAELDISAIFELGIEGFQHLLNLEPKLKPLEEVLFSSAIKDVDRTLLTQAENTKLDSAITLFLSLVSPYFLVNPTGKALEWLIRRFRINEFNVDSLLRCILPYHDTPMFLKMLSIISIKPDSFWSPLIGVRKAKKGFSKSQFINWLSRDLSILKFIIQSASIYAKNTPKYSAFFTFYSTLILGYLQEIKSVSDSILNILLPNIFEGMKDKCIEYRLASLMLFVQISTMTSFNNMLIDSFITLLLDNKFDQDLRIGCLVKVAHSQPSCFDYKFKNERLLNWFSDNNDMVELLGSLGKDYMISTFYTYLVCGLIELNSKNDQTDKYFKTVEHLISLPDLKVDESYLELSSLLIKKASHKKDNKFYHKIISQLDKKCPKLVQLAIAKSLKDTRTKHGSESKELLKLNDFLNNQFKDSASAPLSETNMSLEQSLCHPEITYRISATKHIINISFNNSNPQFRKSISSAILENLKTADDRLSVITIEALEKNPKLSESIDKDDLWLVIQQLPHELKARGYKVVLNSDYIKSKPILTLPYLIDASILDGENSSVANVVHSILNKSNYSATPFLVNQGIPVINNSLSDITELKSYNLQYFNKVIKNITHSKNPEEYINQAISISAITQNRTVSQLLLMIASTSVQKSFEKIASDKKEALIIALTEALSKLLSTLNITTSSNTTASVDNFIEAALSRSNKQNTLADSISISFCLNNLIDLYPEGTNISWLHFDQDDKYSIHQSLALKIFGLLAIQPLTLFLATLTKFIKTILKDSFIHFCCHIVFNPTSTILMKSRALILLSLAIEESFKGSGKLIDYQTLIPILMVAMRSENELVRQSAIYCAATLDSVYSNHFINSKKSSLIIFGKNNFYPNEDKELKYLTVQSAHFLVKCILEGKIEIIKSPQAIKTIIGQTIDQSIDKTNLAVKQYLNGHNKEPKTLNEAFITFILSHVQAFDHPLPQSMLLEVISDIENKSKLRQLSLVISKLFKDILENKAQELTLDLPTTMLLNQTFNLFTPESLAILDQQKDRYINMLTFAMGINVNTHDGIKVNELVLQKISPELFSSLTAKSKSHLFRALISVTSSEDDTLALSSKKILMTLPVTPEASLDALEEVRSRISLSDQASKKVKTDKGAISPSISLPLSQLTTILDVLDNIAENGSFSSLVPILFGIFTQLIDIPNDIDTSINYNFQALLSVLTTIFSTSYANGSEVNESAVRIDLVVQLLRITSSPQVHHQALLLVSAIATVYPEKVLLHVMPIFTFMGANVLQKDDNYSFFIIQQTLEKIIPPLLNSYRQASMKKDNGVDTELVLCAKPIISVFVNALLHIPQHRRVKLFTNLVNVMGTEFLYGVLATILEIYAVKHSQSQREDASKLKDFCVEIATQFSPIVQVKCIHQMLNSILSLPNEKPKDATEEREEEQITNIFNVKEHTDKHLRHYKFSILNFVRELLNSKPFLYQLVEIESDSEDSSFIDQGFIDISENLLLVVDNLRVYLTEYSAREGCNLSIKKFFKSLVGFVYDVLNDTINLLSYPCLTTFLEKLLKHHSSTIRYRSIQLLDSKLETVHSQLSNKDVQSFMGLVDLLVNIVSTNDEVALNKHSALNCLGQYLRCFSHHHGHSEEKFFSAQVVPLLLSQHGLGNSDLQMFASSCVVLSYLCQELSSSVIPHIPEFLPLLLERINETINIDKESEYNNVWVAQFILLDAIMSKLARLTSPYLPTIITLLIQFKVKLSKMENELLLVEKVSSLLDLLRTEIEPRVLFPIIFKLYSSMVEAGADYITALFELVSKIIVSLELDTVEKLYILLFKFYLECFDLRESFKSFDSKEIQKIEEVILQGFVLLVMKLRDDMFKPIFLKLGEWACVDLAGTPHGHSRLITFYHLLELLLTQLKHIFAPYFVYTIDHCIESLDNFKSVNDDDKLWIHLMRTLTLSLQYDTEGIWTADTFNKLLPKLINQMDNVAYQSLAEEFLIPCFDWLANACNTQALWKSLNLAILNKTRADSPLIRCIALRTLRAIYLRQKEGFLIFLPETIPFLAEIMEDDDENVTQATRDLILTIERFNGEPLDQYFR